MRTTNALYFIFVLLLIVSCSRRSEKDYIGNYKTFYATKIELGNAVTGFLFGGRGSKPEITAKTFNDLGEISVELFEGSNGLQGEGSVVIKKAQNMSFSPTETTKKMSFDFSNFRMRNDTLVFSLENEILRLEGKKLRGAIVKNESGIYVGLDKATDIKTVNGPFDASEKDGIQFFKCLEKSKAHELGIDFFKRQEKELIGRIKNESKSNAKKILENSLAEVRKQMKSFAL
jgi:hypothetical protein